MRSILWVAVALVGGCTADNLAYLAPAVGPDNGQAFDAGNVPTDSSVVPTDSSAALPDLATLPDLDRVYDLIDYVPDLFGHDLLRPPATPQSCVEGRECWRCHALRTAPLACYQGLWIDNAMGGGCFCTPDKGHEIPCPVGFLCPYGI